MSTKLLHYIKVRSEKRHLDLFFFPSFLTFSNKKKLSTMVQSIDQRAVDTVRCLAADVVKGANSGHPGKFGI